MAVERIIVGAVGDDSAARSAARRLRDAGHEIVFVGGHQSPEHLGRTALAEDAARIVVDTAGETGALERIAAVCAALGAADIAVEHLM
jgi:methylmalonyl-CoA mutase C-terminal domain/subunit